MFNRYVIINEIENKGWSKYKLSKVSGIPQSSLHDILSGKVKNPTAERLNKLASALDMTVNDFFDDNIEADESVKSEIKTINSDLKAIPEKFADVNKAKQYLAMHSTLPIEINDMTDAQIVELANSFLEQINLTAAQFQRRILIEHNRELEKRLQNSIVAEDYEDYIHTPEIKFAKSRSRIEDEGEARA